MMDAPFRIELASWANPDDRQALRAVREAVFIVEQRIDERDEWDEQDPTSVHALARDAEGRPIGCGRLTPDHHVGRMAVLADWRGRGIGEALLRTLMEHARASGRSFLALHSQVHAIPFYARAGFAPEGPVYDECGIPHQTMRIALSPPERAAPAPVAPTPEDAILDADDLAGAITAVDRLVADARHQLWIYSRDLDRLLYDREPFLDAVKRVALSGRGAMVQILVQEPLAAVHAGHRLLALAARIDSYVQIRKPVTEEDRQYPSAFLLNDVGGFYFRTVGSRFDGEGRTHRAGRHAQLRSYFEQVWARAEPDPELRRLGI